MLRHVVLFKWNERVNRAAVEAFADGLADLPDVIPEIRRYQFGPDVGLGEGRFDFALVADFDDDAGYLAYAQHPDHLQLIAELGRPIVAQRISVQYTVD